MQGWMDGLIGYDQAIYENLPQFKKNRKGPSQPLGYRAKLSIPTLSEGMGG
jgi:hypothetical protein